ncbi:MAG: radical SAM family heme chaperone HemW [Prevotella sp.]|nr:radical SAM family heme chaperone HemW [Prevotella sp.]
MVGLYLHIPFCKSRCFYCGFYSSTHHELMHEYVDALCGEMELRRSVSGIRTIYLGGGTPSQLSPDLLQRLFLYIYKVYEVDKNAEITIECNPDDVTDSYASALASLPVNRVSMGVQTFSDERLRFLRRRHSASQVAEAIERLRRNGIANISIDLMFGFPNETLSEWESDIEEALKLNVEHISAYSLMYEEGTPLYEWKKRMKLEEDDELSREMYETLIDRLTAAGFEHYEISNFARKTPTAGSWRSKHNSCYWNGTHYIGLGAAAHSYDGRTRSWNVADLRQYIQRINNGELATEDSETIDETTRYNDLITTALRTRDGIDLSTFDQRFSPTFKDYLLENAKPHLRQGLLQIEDNQLHLSRNGLFVSDDIMSDLIKLSE